MKPASCLSSAQTRDNGARSVGGRRWAGRVDAPDGIRREPKAYEILWFGSTHNRPQFPRIEGLAGAPDPVGDAQEFARDHHQGCR